MREQVAVIKHRLMSSGGEVRLDCASLWRDEYRRAASRVADRRARVLKVEVTRAVRWRALWPFIGIRFSVPCKTDRNKVCYVSPSRSDGEERCFSERFTVDVYNRQDRPVATGPEFPHRVRGPKGGPYRRSSPLSLYAFSR